MRLHDGIEKIVDENGSEIGSLSMDARGSFYEISLRYGDKIKIKAISQKGYSFEKWKYGENTCVRPPETKYSTDEFLEVSVPENIMMAVTAYAKEDVAPEDPIPVPAPTTPTSPKQPTQPDPADTDEDSQQFGKVTKINLKASKKTVKAGKSLQIKATVKGIGDFDDTVTWKTSNKKYATVSSSGKVKTKKAGKGHTVKITAISSDGKIKKTIKIKIK